MMRSAENRLMFLSVYHFPLSERLPKHRNTLIIIVHFSTMLVDNIFPVITKLILFLLANIFRIDLFFHFSQQSLDRSGFFYLEKRFDLLSLIVFPLARLSVLKISIL